MRIKRFGVIFFPRPHIRFLLREEGAGISSVELNTEILNITQGITIYEGENKYDSPVFTGFDKECRYGLLFFLFFFRVSISLGNTEPHSRHLARSIEYICEERKGSNEECYVSGRE